MVVMIMLRYKRFLSVFFALLIVMSLICPVNALPTDSNDGKIGNNKNVAPQVSFEVLKPKQPVDIIIMTDYSGQKLTDLQADEYSLKQTLIPQNYDVNVNYLQNTIKVGTIQDYLRSYSRSAYLTYYWDHVQWWSPYGAGDFYNQETTRAGSVETAQAYETQENTLPNRASSRVTSYQQIGSHSSTTTHYTDYRLYLSGDVKSYVDVSVDDDYMSKDGSSGRIFDGWHFKSHTVDRSWNPGAVISSKLTDLNILDVDKLKTLTLRPGSARYLVIATDSIYSTGNFTSTLQQYIKDNNIKVKASVNDIAHDWLITQENYVEKVYACTKEIYYFTRSGRILRTGADSNSEYSVDVTDQLPGVDRIEESYGTIFYYSGNNPLFVKSKDGVFSSFPISNVDTYNFVDQYYGSDYMLIRCTNGKIYDYYPDTGSYKLIANKMDTLPDSSFYDVSYRRIVYMPSAAQYYGIQKIERAVTMPGYYFFTYNSAGVTSVYFKGYYHNFTVPVNNVKQINTFGSGSSGYAFVLTTDNKLYHMDISYSSKAATLIKTNINFMPSNSNYDFYTKTFSGALIPVTTDAGEYKNVYTTRTGAIYEGMDGTVQYNGISSINATKHKSDGEWYWAYTPVYTGIISPPYMINGIKKIFTYHLYSTSTYPLMDATITYILDNSNKLYEFMAGHNGETSFWNSWNLLREGVKDFALMRPSGVVSGKLPYYVLMENKTVLVNGYTNTGLSNVKALAFAINDPRFDSEASNIIALHDNGTVSGTGQSTHWQLGQGNPDVTTWVNPLKSRLTVTNTTLPYIRMNDLISSDPNYMYYPQGSPGSAFNDIVNELSYKSGVAQNYLLLNEVIDSKVAYSDYENDPEYQRRWLYSHNAYYFENSLGVDPNSGVYLSAPRTAFAYVGKYGIDLQGRDNPKNDIRFDNYRLWSPVAKSDIYVHRRPVALIDVSVSASNNLMSIAAYDGGSYDLDHVSRSDKGIIQFDWSWKHEYGDWQTGRLDSSGLSVDRKYYIRLRVKDMENVWSAYEIYTIDPNQVFIDASPKSKTWTNANITTTISAFSLVGIQNVRYCWTQNTTKPTSGWITDARSSFATTQAAQGVWYLHMEATDTEGKTMYRYRGPYQIDKTPPTVDSSPASKTSNTPYNVLVTASDTGGSGLRLLNYKLAAATAKPTSGWISGAGSSSSIPIPDGGTWYLHMEAFDNAGNSFYRYRGPFIYISNRPPTITISRTPEGQLYDDDSVTINFTPMDLDAGQFLNVILEERFNGGSWTQVYSKNNVPSGELQSFIKNSLQAGTYEYRATVTDPFLEQAQADLTFTVVVGYNLSNFRVSIIRDFHLEPYYDNGSGQYPDKPFYVKDMAIDQNTFIVSGMNVVPGFTSLTKGYKFEFEIDSKNFNDDTDTIVVTPSFYVYYPGVPATRGPEADLYWEDSNHVIHKTGQGGHAKWNAITLTNADKTITSGKNATWRGEYLIPGTAWPVPKGTTAADAAANKISADIIVNFTIRGYKDGEMKYDYNEMQWPEERTEIKNPYEIGDVIRYDYTKSSLDDIDIIINRP